MSDPLFAVVIPGHPVPKGRPRLGRSGHTFTPAATRNAEEAIAREYRSQVGARDPLTCPLRLELAFHVRTGKGGASGSTRADLDNLVKLVWDALNSVAWVDDVQIVALTAGVHRMPGIEPQTVLLVFEAGINGVEVR